MIVLLNIEPSRVPSRTFLKPLRHSKCVKIASLSVVPLPHDLVASVWWRLREGAGLVAFDTSGLAMVPGTLQPSLTWHRGSLRFSRQSDFVISDVYLPDPAFTTDMHVSALAWAGFHASDLFARI